MNKNLEVNQHPVLRPDKPFAALSGGMKFPKTDLTHAYQQMTLDTRMSPSTPQKSFQVYSLTFWHCISLGSFSTQDGEHFAGTN